MTNNAIIASVKKRILQVTPQARVMLFGSRANGTSTSESDWDILVLTPQPVTSAIKTRLHDALFPVSVKIGAFINTLVVQDTDWDNDPAYYSLHQTVNTEMIPA